SRPRSRAVRPAPCGRGASAPRRRNGSSRSRCAHQRTDRSSSPGACGSSTPREPSSTRARRRPSAAVAARATSRSATAPTRRMASVADAVLTLYQAEWCPFSSAVREVLTELGLDFVARQVEPWSEQRGAMRDALGTDQIPTLETEDGRVFRGTRAIYAYLRELEPWEHSAAHRHRF